MDKLDYLAQKEEELRKLNDKMDSKQADLLQNVQDIESSVKLGKADEKDLFTGNNAWKVNDAPVAEESKNADGDEAYDDEGFDEGTPVPSQPTGKKA